MTLFLMFCYCVSVVRFTDHGDLHQMRICSVDAGMLSSEGKHLWPH